MFKPLFSRYLRILHSPPLCNHIFHWTFIWTPCPFPIISPNLITGSHVQRYIASFEMKYWYKLYTGNHLVLVRLQIISKIDARKLHTITTCCQCVCYLFWSQLYYWGLIYPGNWSNHCTRFFYWLLYPITLHIDTSITDYAINLKHPTQIHQRGLSSSDMLRVFLTRIYMQILSISEHALKSLQN